MVYFFGTQCSYNGILTGTYASPTSHFERPWVILSNLAKYLMTRSVARSHTQEQCLFQTANSVVRDSIHWPKQISTFHCHCVIHHQTSLLIMCVSSSSHHACLHVFVLSCTWILAVRWAWPLTSYDMSLRRLVPVLPRHWSYFRQFRLLKGAWFRVSFSSVDYTTNGIRIKLIACINKHID